MSCMFCSASWSEPIFRCGIQPSAHDNNLASQWPIWIEVPMRAKLGVSEMASAKMASAIVSVSTMWGRYWNSYRLPFWREFCWVLQARVAFGVDTEFPYRVRIVDRGLITATLFAATISDSQTSQETWVHYVVVRHRNCNRQQLFEARAKSQARSKFDRSSSKKALQPRV